MINVKDYGALGDGNQANVAVDTKAFASALAAAGSTGIVYFPEGVYWIDGTQITFPQQPRNGWLTVLLDGTINLINGPLRVGSNCRIEGRCGDPEGLNGAFVYDRSASIQVLYGQKFPCIDAAGVTGCVLKGLNLQASAAPALHIHDDNGAGSCWNKISQCVMNSGDPNSPAILIDSSGDQINAGFGLLINETSLRSLASYGIKATNFGGQLFIRDSYFGCTGVYAENRGIPGVGGYVFDNILTEGFIDGASLLTIRYANGASWFSNVVMRQIQMADPLGSAYLLDCPPNGSPAKWTLAGLALEAFLGPTAIFKPGSELGAASVHGYDWNGSPIYLNPYSAYDY